MSASPTFVAVARRRDLPALRLLAADLGRHHPGAPLKVLLLPGAGPRPRSDEPFEVLTASAAGLLDVARMLPDAPPAAVDALARPLALRHALDHGAGTAVLLAADSHVTGPLDELLAAAANADAVVVPLLQGHLPDDGRRPDAQDLLDAGELDDGLVAVRDTADGIALLEWWADRAHTGARAAARAEELPPRALASPLEADRHLPADIRRLEHPGYAVSSWNLHERELARNGDGVLTAAGEPIRHLRFAGFRPDRPWWLSADHNRVLVLDDPLLEELVARRAEALVEQGWSPRLDLADLPDRLPNGLQVDRRVRKLLVEAMERGEDFGDVTTEQGADALLAWLTEPAPHGAAAGITRYHWDVWRERPDVQEAYPDLDGEHGEGYAGWLWTQGRSEMGLQTRLMPPWPAWLGEPPAEDDAPVGPPSVLVTGFMRGTLGLGQAARAYTAALRAGGVPVGTRAVTPDPPVERMPRGAKPRDDRQPWDDLELDEAPGVNLLCVNPEQLPAFNADPDAPELGPGYTIGVWGWEVEGAPEGWGAAYDLVDEVWTYSSWSAEQLTRGGDVPVLTMPLPVEAPGPPDAELPFAMPDGFTFLFVFDFFSTLARKNPLGLVEAFRQAFAPGEGPQLLIKTLHAEHRPEAAERLRHAAAGRDDIHLADAELSRAQLDTLFHRADAYVSLHRAEGFGLTLAEAMALGKPVVGTGYSGTTDFMTPANSWLVDYELVGVGEDAEHYPADARWAEPSVEHAAAALREIVDRPDEAHRRGERARRDIAAALSTEACGRLVRHRLERIAAWRAGRPQPSATEPAALRDLDDLVAFPLEPGAVGGMRSAVRRGAMEALSPYLHAERRLDEAVVGAMHRLWFELARERAARERDHRRIAALERRLDQLGRPS